MPTPPRPPAPPPLPPADNKIVAVKRYEAGPPIGKELVEPGETVATTKEEEWVTKKTRELTTTRQIATRVQRQVLLEDGKVLQDSGPLVSTTTSEDTETQEHEHTEHRKLDDPPGSDVDAVDGAQAQIEDVPGVVSGDLVAKAKWVPVANPDGKVREIKEKRVLTHEETDEIKETEERQHYGDITDEAYLKAVSTGVEDIRGALKLRTDEDLSKALVATGPKLVHESTKTKKTIDTEEKEESRALQADGQILTESKVTTEHEEINDQDLPDEEGKSLSSGSQEVVREAGQRWRQTRDQEFVDHMAGGMRLNREMRYNADTEEGEKFGDPGMDDPHDWDSLSARVRKQRRQGHRTLMQRQRDAELHERKDALTKKPIDYDQEEETRKKETSKWLEHHFGSDSRSSRDSIGDELDEGPSTSYFNVTIKSQPTNHANAYTEPPPPPRAKSPPRQKPYVAQVTSSSRVFVPSPEPEVTPTPTRVKGYFQGVSEWSQRRAEEARNRVDSPPSPVHPRNLRSPALQRDDSAYVSSSTVNTPYRRTSPERASPFQSLDRRDSSERAYSPYRYKQYRQDERCPAPPERKRAMERKQRSSDESARYDSGYRSQSRNDTYRGEEPAPDYSPPRGNGALRRGSSKSPPRSSPARSPQLSRVSRKPTQRTRFAPEEPRPAGERRSVGAAIGQSIRKLVGKIRSASQERRGRQKGKRQSRSPSPRREGQLSSTYQQYGSVDSDPPAVGRQHTRAHHTQSSASSDMERRAPASPLQRYYLGEDPFGGSIYGRENKYDGARPHKTPSRKTYVNGHNGHNGHATNGDDHRANFTTTLGRFSKSTSRLTHNGHSSDDYLRNSQTLPRKLVDEQVHTKSYHQASASPSNRQWDNDRLTNNKRSSSTINVSIVNVTPPSSSIGVNSRPVNGAPIQGPVKPARTYKALNRSKSFNVHAMEPLNDTPKSSYFGNSNRLNSSNVYKSNPHLSRLDETPEQLKSPGIVSIISRSQRDLSGAVREEEEQKENLHNSRFAKKTSYTNGYQKSQDNGMMHDKKKIFMKGLLERAPELYHTLQDGDEVDGLNGRSKSPIPAYNGVKNGYKKQTYYEDNHYKSSDPYRRDTGSPYRPINGVDKFKSAEGYNNSPLYSVVRRGSANSDNFSETYRTTSRSDDPRRPSVTNMVQTVSKKTIPSMDGRKKETIESTETTTVTKSRYLGEPMSNLKYVENSGRINGFDPHRRGSGHSSINDRRGSNGVVIEVRDYRK
ncbi:chascon isoform X2 [Arctopsyche grandis]|uniref:chascon isoform X2 n=1 Tax=Arctopsyche grandis TaxID=121162 RepID=UPI00406D90DF